MRSLKPPFLTEKQTKKNFFLLLSNIVKSAGKAFFTRPADTGEISLTVEYKGAKVIVFYVAHDISVSQFLLQAQKCGDISKIILGAAFTPQKMRILSPPLSNL